MMYYTRNNITVSSIIRWLFSWKLPNAFIALLVVSYVFVLLYRLIAYLFALPLRFGWDDVEQPLRLLYLPSSFSTYMEQWWSVLTFMLIPQNFFEVLLSVLMLYVFGKIFSEFWYAWHFVLLVIVSVIATALFFMFSENITLFAETPLTYIHGASSVALTLTGFILIFLPKHQFRLMYILKLPIMYVVAFILLLLFMFFSPTKLHAFAYGVSFLSGIATGAIYKWVQRKLYNYKRKYSKKRRLDDFVQTRTDEEYQEIKKARQEKLDQILDKIARYGYDSLSKEEKDFLFFESKR